MNAQTDNTQQATDATTGGTITIAAFGSDTAVVDHVPDRTVGQYLEGLGRTLEHGQKAQINGRVVEEDQVPQPGETILVASAVKNG